MNLKWNEVIDNLKTIPIDIVAVDLAIPLNRHHRGNCPTGHPSESEHCFSLNLKNNSYKCFHCGISGDTISLYQLINQLAFRDAVVQMAPFYLGIDLSVKTKTSPTIPDYESNKYRYHLKLLQLEKELVNLDWEVRNKYLLSFYSELMDQLEGNKIAIADYYTHLENLHLLLDGYFARMDEDKIKHDYEIIQERQRIGKEYRKHINQTRINSAADGRVVRRYRSRNFEKSHVAG